MNSIQQQFDRAAKTYDQNSAIQRRIAEALMKFMNGESLVPTRVLELGCGTGNLTRELIDAFPNSGIMATDSSQSMLDECAAKLRDRQVQFRQMAAQDFPGENLSFDLVASSMTLQWVDGWQQVVADLSQMATVCFTIPIDGSFQSWIDVHNQLGLQHGIRPLPCLTDLEELQSKLNKRVSIEIQEFNCQFERPINFVRNLKLIGANSSRIGHVPVNLRKVFKRFTNGLTVNYRVALVIIQEN